ncbi:MAG TPA: TonB-dependent receptor, partial [Saprospirales bacterium]|nr:TonB-dependent receptor [Saprospirales bacterium]
KVEATDVDGKFKMSGIDDGNYFLKASYIGMEDINQTKLNISKGNTLDLGKIIFSASSVKLETAVITAKRALIEVKADRTVFNIEGTVNSAGENGLSLMRKAPGVLVDNNDNISVLSRSGVLIYLDGKRLPLAGEDLANYLQGIPAEQIDKIDIITNPGAKYEAEGNAGIIDIRLKKDKSHGANGTVSGSFGMGELPKYNGSLSGNYRNSKVNAFGTLGAMNNENFNTLNFKNFQNKLIIDEKNRSENTTRNVNYRLGTDYYVAEGHILGFLVTGRNGETTGRGNNRSEISFDSVVTQIDSVLIANNQTDRTVSQYTANTNYRYQKNNNTFNIDLDFGRFNNDGKTNQPNEYFTEDGIPLSSVITSYTTPRVIDIYTGKIDY